MVITRALLEAGFLSISVNASAAAETSERVDSLAQDGVSIIVNDYTVFNIREADTAAAPYSPLQY